MADELIDPKENGVNERHSQTYSNDVDRMRTDEEKKEAETEELE